MTDAALVKSLKQGEPEAYRLLYDRYWKLLYSKALSRVVDEEAAQDIVQHIFISIWDNRENLEIHTTLSGFLQNAVKYQVFNHFRSTRITRRVLDQAAYEVKQILEEADVLQSQEVLEQSLTRALEGMPETIRQTFLLRRDNVSIKEISARLNLAEQTVSNHLTEAIRRLRKKLTNQSISDEYLFALFLLLLNN
ncbi:sigma-70 family RNA polymerase sigma factor [Parapedobacter sp. ISTM3]|uniref:RNA polymerase sigma factor n=1 Tax=Parapedobacter sp. ISTM3 TaxID=2800130 RepID=UPI0019059452|nr:sigma-70 family RNA polymerase sigma factor [Parapedobacter sp. ISTM3]MBK1438880.1 sigma-70 family RNA polymerase sigma factor [Parapedobacter sp. ISTM3]